MPEFSGSLIPSASLVVRGCCSMESDHPLTGTGHAIRRRRTVAFLALVLLAVPALAVPVAATAPAMAVSPSSTGTVFSDNFSQDRSLNPALWQINGSAAANFSSADCGGPCTFVNLTPTFSSAGMEIANIDGSSEAGSISSVQDFTPPFTATAMVEGTISNGHTFIFAVTNLNATAGVQMTGNLDAKDCSAETNCGDHSTCGTSANASIPTGQCYYGIYGRVGAQQKWSGKDWLVDSPILGVEYTLQISIDTSGTAVGQVSQGGQILATASAPVGAGPFYLIIAQGEGAPVPGPGPNQAYWQMMNVTSSALPVPGSSSSPGSSGSAWWWIILVVIVVAIVLMGLVVVRRRRRRGFTVTVLDAGTLSPVSGAGVSADGPSNLSGSTRTDGRIAFGGVKDGEYSLKASAAGYSSPPPVTVSVTQGSYHTVRLTRVGPAPPEGPSPGAPSVAPVRPAEQPRVAAPSTAPTAPTPTAVSTPAAPAGPVELEPGEVGEGWVGMRIREIVKTFQEKGAVSPETALTAQELGLSRMFVRIMKRRRGQTRVFVEINGKYYLDENALREMK
ncbi:MAG TPA: carboxypeptidase-like regulatory domain-containing protein [Thermoplasmata archaeon]|nr:carboxypeptidase-like regulatory domain-containing protein [Thermoplasmata archaeon]